ncbi:zinc metallopeptidase [Puniceicoccaceae bacterium K14]|nr:zinc metallopeptidase [Puniceicoccaceae bacterium K14]
MTIYLFLIIIPFLLGLWAQHQVSSTYKKYAAIPSQSGISGKEAAAYVLRKAGVSDVEIVSVKGTLTDHYDPRNRRLALSEQNYHGNSLAALGVAAHEADHAIQHKVGYSALQLRMSLIPITSVASQMLPFVIIGGFFFQIAGLINLGILVYLVLTIFQLVTLPVEFDASRRAKVELAGLGIVTEQEAVGVRKTLDAAAWTYVAAFVATLGNLIYLIMASRR